MKSHRKLDLTVNVEGLKQSLKNNRNLFGQYNYRGESATSPHREMLDIWVRYNDVTPYLESGDFSTFADEHDSVWYPCLEKLPEVLNIVFPLMTHVQGERLGGVLITKLPPGGQIYPHKDAGWHASYYDKYYVPIQNRPGSTFNFHDGVIRPREGEVYWFDNSNFHWVNNDSNIERIAMIICIKTRGEF